MCDSVHSKRVCVAKDVIMYVYKQNSYNIPIAFVDMARKLGKRTHFANTFIPKSSYFLTLNWCCTFTLQTWGWKPDRTIGCLHENGLQRLLRVCSCSFYGHRFSRRMWLYLWLPVPIVRAVPSKAFLESNNCLLLIGIIVPRAGSTRGAARHNTHK